MSLLRNSKGSGRRLPLASGVGDRAANSSSFDLRIPRARIEELARTGQPHLRPIYAAIAGGSSGFLLVPQNRGRFDFMPAGPFVALICDDTDRALGPDAFHRKSVRRLAERMRSITIIASGIVPGVYASAASLGTLGFSSLIVETRPEQERAWLDLLKGAAPSVQILLCTPTKGTA